MVPVGVADFPVEANRLDFPVDAGGADNVRADLSLERCLLERCGDLRPVDRGDDIGRIIDQVLIYQGLDL